MRISLSILSKSKSGQSFDAKSCSSCRSSIAICNLFQFRRANVIFPSLNKNATEKTNRKKSSGIFSGNLYAKYGMQGKTLSMSSWVNWQVFCPAHKNPKKSIKWNFSSSLLHEIISKLAEVNFSAIFFFFIVSSATWCYLITYFFHAFSLHEFIIFTKTCWDYAATKKIHRQPTKKNAYHYRLTRSLNK